MQGPFQARSTQNIILDLIGTMRTDLRNIIKEGILRIPSFIMVETAGIEPASENLSIQLSPGADGQFKFPAPVRRPSGWPKQYPLIRHPGSGKPRRR